MADDEAVMLSIGELARRTGLTTSGLRMWERRFGFPAAYRLAGGHRRYRAHHVRLVREVVERRASGVRLEDAIDQVLREAAPVSPSVFATLRTRHPHLEVNRMRKPTLLALSWAAEDEAAALADPAVVWCAFQQERFYRPALPRWRDLARSTAGVTVFAAFETSDTTSLPRRVALPEDAPMRREWAVVVDSVELPVVMSAWELPGQDAVADRDRVFEAIWTIEPVAVRDAARVCAEVARSVDPQFHRDQYAAAPPLGRGEAPEASPSRVGGLLARTATYVDRFVATA